jgi:plasmid stabilization system protein ParE
MMERNKLVILKAAQEEMEEIGRMYTGLVGPKSARKIGRRLHEALGHLRDHPYMGVVLSEGELNQRGYRKLICGNYLCFYRLIGDTVYVYHVADGRTDYKRLFRGLPED